MVQKSQERRFKDLIDNAELLLEACHRYKSSYKVNELKIIGVMLRVLVGKGKGNGILFSLADMDNDTFEILILNQKGTITIEEIDEKTGKIVQEVSKTAIIFQDFQNMKYIPIVRLVESYVPYHKIPNNYSIFDLEEWINEGFLLDWQIESLEPKRFTPRDLIQCYANSEGAHADKSYGVLGGSVESQTFPTNYEGREINVSVIYEFLYQIGLVVASISSGYAERKLKDV